jgi:hypothetical protein
VRAFEASMTQWRTAPIGAAGTVKVVWLGLDYCAAKVAIEALGLALTGELFAGLRVMELEARAALNGE